MPIEYKTTFITLRQEYCDKIDERKRERRLAGRGAVIEDIMDELGRLKKKLAQEAESEQ